MQESNIFYFQPELQIGRRVGYMNRTRDGKASGERCHGAFLRGCSYFLASANAAQKHIDRQTYRSSEHTCRDTTETYSNKRCDEYKQEITSAPCCVTHLLKIFTSVIRAEFYVQSSIKAFSPLAFICFRFILSGCVVSG